jgi:hypothetical protein
MKEPFVGLRPFDVSDGDIFFGRRRETQILTNLALTLPLFLVYATSGTGKSSLLRAGLVPALRDNDALPVYTADPADDIGQLLTRELKLADPPDDRIDFVRAFTEFGATGSRRPVVILDQFEERLKDREHLPALWDALAALGNTRSDVGTVIISIRDDYLSSLDGLLRRVSGLMDGSYLVPNLSDAALVEAVTGPLRVAGHGMTTSERTIDEVLGGLHNEKSGPEGDRVEAGYFQIVWSHLWNAAKAANSNEITTGLYKRCGGSKGIVNQFVNGTLDSLLPFEAEALCAALRYLILPSGAKMALTIDDLRGLILDADYSATGHDLSWGVNPVKLSDWLEPALMKLLPSESPLLRRRVRRERVEYELLHDLLGPILLQWRIRRLEEAPRRVNAVAEKFSLDQNLAAERLAAKPRPGTARGVSRRLLEAIDKSKPAGPGEIDRAVAGAEEVYEALVEESLLDTSYNYRFDEVLREWLRAVSDATVQGADSAEIRGAQEMVIRFSVLRSIAGRGRPLQPSPHGPSQTTLEAVVTVGLAIVAAAVLSFGGFGLAWLLLDTVFPLPHVEYLPLSITFAALVQGIVVLAVLGMSGDGSTGWRKYGTALRAALLPTDWDLGNGLGERLLVGGLFVPLRTWPVAMVAALGLAYLGAATFEFFGWSATAGFNLIGLLGGAAVVIGEVLANEDL